MEALADKKEKIEALVIEFSRDKDLIDFVEKTESRIATTKGHYGDYMNFLIPYASNSIQLYIISRALLMAKADAIGISSAIRIITGKELAL